MRAATIVQVLQDFCFACFILLVIAPLAKIELSSRSIFSHCQLPTTTINCTDPTTLNAVVESLYTGCIGPRVRILGGRFKDIQRKGTYSIAETIYIQPPINLVRYARSDCVAQYWNVFFDYRGQHFCLDLPSIVRRKRTGKSTTKYKEYSTVTQLFTR